MPTPEKEDPWTVFLREELIRVRTSAQNRPPSMRDPEAPAVQTRFENDDHETVVVDNKTKVKRPSTPETIKESPPPSPAAPSPPIIIERPNVGQRSAVLSCIGQNKGIIIAIILIYLFAATGFGVYPFSYFYSKPPSFLYKSTQSSSTSGGFLLQQFLGIPSLNREISQLTTQLDRFKHENEMLQGGIQNLTIQLDRQAQINSELEKNTTYLQSQVNQTQGLVQVLNSSLTVKEQLNDELQTQVILYQQSLTDANNTLLSLSTLNNNLNTQVDILNSTLDNYTLANGVLQTQVNNLTSSVSSLNDTVLQLNSTVDQLQNQTTILKALNSDLGTVVSFLNVTANQNAQVYQNFIGYLADQITVYRGLVAMDLELYYRSFIDNWTADFTSRFGLYPFGMNDTIPFGSYYSAVITRIYNKDLGYLCVNQTDFERYLYQEILPSGTNVSQTNLQYLEEAVSKYSVKLLDYYFPANSTSTPYGLKIGDWENATWTCDNLPTALRFSFEKYNNLTSTVG